MPRDDESRTRPAFVTFGIIVAVVMLLAIFWMQRGPGALPVGQIIEEMKASEPVKRVTAAEGLGALGDPAGVDALIAALKDQEWTVRRAAADALGKIRDGRSAQPLVEALKDNNVWVQIAAIRALGKVGDASSVAPLENLLKAEKAKPAAKQNADLLTYAEAAIQEIKK